MAERRQWSVWTSSKADIVGLCSEDIVGWPAFFSSPPDGRRSNRLCWQLLDLCTTHSSSGGKVWFLDDNVGSMGAAAGLVTCSRQFSSASNPLSPIIAVQKWITSHNTFNSRRLNQTPAKSLWEHLEIRLRDAQCFIYAIFTAAWPAAETPEYWPQEKNNTCFVNSDLRYNVSLFRSKMSEILCLPTQQPRVKGQVGVLN